MRIALPYGEEMLKAEVDWVRPLGTLDVADVPELPNIEDAIRSALERPIGLDRNIFSVVSPGETIVVLVSDMFRKTCAHQFLPILVEGLGRAGVADDAVSFLFATGTHRAPTVEEQGRILGEGVYARFRERVYVHDPCDAANLVHFGTTSRGTPVGINRRACEADRVIATGAVVLHYFAGYGGGRKSVLPGIASIASIAHNHAMNLDPEEDRLNPAVKIGVLDGNPVAEDMREAAGHIRIDYVINTVLNRNGEMAGIFAGDLDAAHRAAAEYARRLYACPIRERADLVIASSGTAENFVQSHKALYNAFQAVKPTGRIVFLGRCKEGLGGEQLAKWLRLGSREAIIAGLRKEAEINGQTALSTIEKAPMALFVTEMAGRDVALLKGTKAHSLDEALELAREALEPRDGAMPTCYLMPSASYTVPFLNG